MTFKSIGVKEGSDQNIAFDEDGAGGIEGDVQLGKIYYGAEGVFNNDFATGAKQDEIKSAVEISAGTREEGTLTAAGIGVAHANLLVPSGAYRSLQILNWTDGDVVISLDGGSSDHWVLSPGEKFKEDHGANRVTASGTIQVKDGTKASTTGAVYAIIYTA